MSLLSSAPRAYARHCVALAAACLAASSFAQTPGAEASATVVVSATRSPQALADVLADVSVLTRADIERSGATDVAELLARLPGIEFSRNGGPGATTSVFIRGGDSRHVAVYLDGVRIDSQSTGGANWEQIPLAQIERVEVMRGPGAAVYGSSAISGVVQLFTRSARSGVQPSAQIGVGSHGTVTADAALRGSAQAFDYAVSLAHARSDGFNARTTSNPDRDGHWRHSAHLRGGLEVATGHRLDATLVASRMRAQYDGWGNDDDISDHTLRTTSLAWQGRWSPQSTTRAHAGRSQTTYETQPSFYRTETTLDNLLLQHEWVLGGQRLQASAEHLKDRLHNPASDWVPTLRGERTQDALALGWRAEFGAHALQAHARHDRDSEFGGHGTASLAWGWTFTPRWRLSASAATSFRAPTLYQRFSEYGTSTLQPEKGRNAELALSWSAPGGHSLSLTGWRNTVRQLIEFDAPGPCASSYGCYANVSRARLQGMTLAARYTLGPVNVGASFDWHDPRNLDTDLILARRARRLATLTADTTVAGWRGGVALRASGARYDNAANTQRVGGWAVVDAWVERPLGDQLTVYARIDNLADKSYELARTYATGGRQAQVGLRWALP